MIQHTHSTIRSIIILFHIPFINVKRKSAIFSTSDGSNEKQIEIRLSFVVVETFKTESIKEEYILVFLRNWYFNFKPFLFCMVVKKLNFEKVFRNICPWIAFVCSIWWCLVEIISIVTFFSSRFWINKWNQKENFN